MAIKLLDEYPGKVASATAAYPFGSARNVTTPGDGTGTPWEEAIVNDMIGFYQALLTDVGATPTGSIDKVGASQYLDAVKTIIGRLNFDTLALAIAAAGLVDGDTVNLKERSTGNGGGAIWDVFPAGTFTLDFDVVAHDTLPLQLKLRIRCSMCSDEFGTKGDTNATGTTGTDDTAAMQRAIVVCRNVTNDGSKIYRFDGELYLPAKHKWDAQNATLVYTGEGTGIGQTTRWEGGVSTGPVAFVTLGEEVSSALQKQIQFVNYKINLAKKTSTAVVLYGCQGVLTEGETQGLFQPFDNTRSNIAVRIRGSATGSNFGNVISVLTNHMNKGFRLENYGVANTQPTSQLFLNCETQTDYDTDDSGIGYDFSDSTVANQGQGSKIVGGNIETTKTGIYHGALNDGLDVNTRWEIETTNVGSRKIVSHATASNLTAKGSTFDAALIGAVNAGWEGFGNDNGNRMEGSDGSQRTGGNDASFSGLNLPVDANGYLITLYKEDVNIAFRHTKDETNTSRWDWMPGRLSGGDGSYLQLNGAAASNAGDFKCGWALGSGGDFAVTNGRNGAEIFVVDNVPAVRPGSSNTTLCGTGAFPWSGGNTQVAFTVTSDADYKTEPKPITDKVLDAWSNVEYCSFQLLSSIEEKGKDKARIHFGVIAQQVKKIFEDAGLNPFDYALLCWDEWEDQYRNVSETYTDTVIITPEIKDKKGVITQEYKEEFEVDVPAHKKLTAKAGKRYGIRYEQIFILEAALMRRELNKLKTKLEAL